MKILVGCEESQRVCMAFRNKGHEAYSCDIQEPSGGHPEWHILGDCLSLLNGNCIFTTMDGVEHKVDGKWDMLLLFPPCTDLAISGNRYFSEKRADGRQRASIEFFMKCMTADCDKICVENPINIIGGEKYLKEFFPDLCDKYGLPIKPTQRIQPWWFGEPVQKTTQLWLKGLDPLVPIVKEKPQMGAKEWVWNGIKKKESEYNYKVSCASHKERAKIRSKTFEGVAKAFADQWG